jgi:LysM repeat protein
MNKMMGVVTRGLIGTWLLLALPGCGGGHLAAALADAEAARRHADTVVRDTAQEAAALRAELAATRIAAAKQEADDQDLLARLAELRRTVETRQGELASLRVERDQLVKTNVELQGQLAEAVRARQVAADGGQTQSKVQALEAALAQVVEQLADVRRSVKQGSSKNGELRGRPSSWRSPPLPSAPPADLRTMMDRLADGSTVSKSAAAVPPAADPDRPAMTATVAVHEPDHTLLVESGDSLLMLARKHGVTVRALMEANGLVSDRILIGQRLLVPPATTSSGPAPTPTE